MKRLEQKLRKREQRKKHIRKKVFGTKVRPRMTVFKSNKHMYVQVIDDEAGHTIASVSDVESDNKELKHTVADAAKLGEIVGKRLNDQKIDKVVFDRNGYPYHGIVKAIADGTRKAGIQF